MRGLWSPALETWRPRVNGVQLKVGRYRCGCAAAGGRSAPNSWGLPLLLRHENSGPAVPAKWSLPHVPAWCCCHPLNPVQLLQGARLPEAEAEWGALEGALAHLGPYLRADTSPGRLLSELRDFVGLLDMWWANRKRGEGAWAGMEFSAALGPGLLPAMA